MVKHCSILIYTLIYVWCVITQLLVVEGRVPKERRRGIVRVPTATDDLRLLIQLYIGAE